MLVLGRGGWGGILLKSLSPPAGAQRGGTALPVPLKVPVISVHEVSPSAELQPNVLCLVPASGPSRRFFQ